MRYPRTAAEWQEAANGASFFLAVDAARQYGLITGGPQVNQERCDRILKRGARKGIYPLPLEQLLEQFKCFLQREEQE